MYVLGSSSHRVTSLTTLFSNNSLRHSMTALGLPSSTISVILDDPTILGSRTSETASSFADLVISTAVAERILGAYIQGFRTVFLLNAGLNAVATVAAIVLIRHTELNRGDEDDLRKRAKDEAALQASEKNSIAETKAELPALPDDASQHV